LPLPQKDGKHFASGLGEQNQLDAGMSFNRRSGRMSSASLRDCFLQMKPIKARKMANVYVEARPKGRPEGSPIQDYVVEDHADQVLGTFPTQKQAIDWAKAKGHSPLVARVRHLNNKRIPDHWRAV